MIKKNVIKADPVLIDFFASIDDEVSAFENEANQAQYGYDVGSYWYPQEQGAQASNAFADTASAQTQLQKQLEQTEQMFASAGFNVGSFPPTMSTQSSFASLPPNGLTGGNNQFQASSLPAQIYQPNVFGAAPVNNPFESTNRQTNQFQQPSPASLTASASPFNPFGSPAPAQTQSAQANPFGAQPAAQAKPAASNNTFTVDNVFGNFGAGPAKQQAPTAATTVTNQWAPKPSGLSSGFTANDIFGDLDSLGGYAFAPVAVQSKPVAPAQSFGQAAPAQSFGVPAQAQQFGQPAPAQSFGQHVQAQAFGGMQSFGNVQQQSPFGGIHQQQNPFGSAPQQSSFGGSQQQQQNPFGNMQQQSNFFGAPQQPQQQQSFGQNPAFNPFGGSNQSAPKQQAQPAAFNPFGDLGNLGSSGASSAPAVSRVSPNYTAAQGQPQGQTQQPRSQFAAGQFGQQQPQQQQQQDPFGALQGSMGNPAINPFMFPPQQGFSKQ